MTKRRIVIGVLVVAVIAALTVPIRRVQDVHAGAVLFWHSDEAYLFIGTRRLGFRAPPAKLLLPLLMLAPFGIGVDDSHSTLAVFRITRDRIDRYVADNMQLGQFSLSDGRIRNSEWRWDGDHFERLTYEEAVADSRTDLEFSGVDGWSKRSVGWVVTPPAGKTVAFELSGEPASLISHAVERVSASIDLQRGSGAPERLWSINQRQRSVSRAEYQTRSSSGGLRRPLPRMSVEER